MNTVSVWKPRIVRFIRAKFSDRCYWCGDPVNAGTAAAFYADEKELAHERCHSEACR